MKIIKKIVLDNLNKEQSELIVSAYRGEGEAKNALNFWVGEIVKEQIEEYTAFECDDLPVDKLELVAKIEIPITITNRGPRKKERKTCELELL